MNRLRGELITALTRIYEIEGIEDLTVFFQGELHTMQYLYRNADQDIYPSMLSDALHVTRARITSTLAGLRKKGFVTMSICENDRRRMHVNLTAEGRRFLEMRQDRVLAYLDQWIRGLGEKNIKEMIRLIHLSADLMNSGGMTLIRPEDEQGKKAKTSEDNTRRT